MKLIILFLAIGACLANPVEELQSIFKEAEAKATPNLLDKSNLFEYEADESQNAPEVEKDSVALLGPVGPVVNENIKVEQPIDLLPAELKPEEGDLKTDATFWYGGGGYGRSWGYPSWGYASPYYGRSYYRPRHYYRPSFYRWYW